MKKIIVILGGGRTNGNTMQLAEAFMKGAEEAGHQAELISLNELKVNGCTGCNACRYGKPCVQKDDFNSFVPKIKAADLIVFASPLYFWTISSKIKAFIERFYCIAEKDENPPLGRYEKYPVRDCALLMTSADNFFGPLSRRFPTISLPSIDKGKHGFSGLKQTLAALSSLPGARPSVKGCKFAFGKLAVACS